MKKFFVLALCVVFVLILVLLKMNNVSENIIYKDLSDDDSKKYDVSVTDDSIYFNDDLGNGIFFNFDGNKITSVLTFVKTESKESAEELKNFYLENLNSGDIKNITVGDNGIFIYYSDTYISNFEGRTKEEIKNMLLGEM